MLMFDMILSCLVMILKKTIRNYDDILLLDDHYTFVKMSSIVLHKDLKPGFYSSKYLLDQNGQSLAK